MNTAFETLREVFSLVWSQADGFVKARLTGALLLIALASALTALGPVALKLIVDGFTRPMKATAMSAALWVGLYVASQWLARSVGEIRGLVYVRAERRMTRTLSERLFDHILRLPLRFHLDRQTGALTQSLTNGLQGYQTVLHTLVFSVLPVAAELGTVVVVLAKLGQPTFLTLFCAAILCYAIVFSYAARKTMKAARDASAAQVEANGTMTDSVLNYETIKYFAAEEIVEQKVGGALIRSEEEWVRFYRQYAVNGLLVATIYAAFLGTTILYAAHEVQGDRISIGTFVLINTYMLQILRPVETLGYAVQSLSQGVAYLDKMLELFRERTEVDSIPFHRMDGEPESEADEEFSGALASTFSRSRAGMMTLRPLRGEERTRTVHTVPYGIETALQADEPSKGHRTVRGELEFRDVCFSYRPDRPVLRGVSFTIRAGKTLGIVGASGSGKSTIVRLLVRLLDPDSGQILLDGVPIQSLSLATLRQGIAVVPQDTALFNDTIGYNIAFGRSGGSYEDIVQAARRANLHDFIVSLPERYETQVGERGVKLSGGEKQRVSIARAARKNPWIYVADEATSSLDSRTEREIVKNLEEVSRNTTTLVIAHRLSTVVNADEIVVLDAGVIAERGTHESLLSRKGRYAMLWAAQHPGPLAVA